MGKTMGAVPQVCNLWEACTPVLILSSLTLSFRWQQQIRPTHNECYHTTGTVTVNIYMKDMTSKEQKKATEHRTFLHTV